MESLDQRWARLSPHVAVHGPDDGQPRPAVLLFHGCGGLRAHLDAYARAAVEQGWRAFVIDSYAPRGWSRSFALSFVCTGVFLRGSERAGDVLAALHGISARPDVRSGQIALAGWSHGGWSIMELMSAELSRPSNVGLRDADEALLDQVRGVFLAYAYLGPGAHAGRRWSRCPKVMAVLPDRDHLTTPRHARDVFDKITGCGAEVEQVAFSATHAFDEPEATLPMRHDPVLMAEAIGHFRRFLGGL